jgi:catechol 2,3-dioxygenase-like lactoylglutathione lyase family enzyme
MEIEKHKIIAFTLVFVLGLITAVSLSAVASSMQGSKSDVPMQGKTMRVKRATVLVHDLDRSIAFYRDVLGLELYDLETEYNTNLDSYGYFLFNIPVGARKRMALFNTSSEVRGFAIEEVPDFEWVVQQEPRTAVVLFETGDIKELEKRLRKGGYTVYQPAKGDAYDVHFVELGFLDPDGHLLAAYQYFPE